MAIVEAAGPKVSAADRAYEALRDAVIEGRYEAGTMLGEAALATDLAVSRTPVRAALLRLQSDGWLVIYPKRGALVRGIPDSLKADLADARLVLESTSLGRAPQEVLGRLVPLLERSLDEQCEALSAGDIRGYIDLTIAFHRHFVEAGNNEILLELNDRLADRQRFLLFAARDRLLADGDRMLAEHRQLVVLLRAGDLANFPGLLREHIAHAYAAPVQPLLLSRR